MLYELRIYHCVPGRLPDLLKRFDTITWASGSERHRAGRVLDHRDRRFEPGAALSAKWESLADREKKWNAFQADPEWHTKRAQTEANGAIVARVENSILQPTGFSAVK